MTGTHMNLMNALDKTEIGEMKMNAKVYQRQVAGPGIQTLVFIDGKCIRQYLTGRGFRYTGDGNPEFVGMTPRQIGMKANGFRQVRSARCIEHAVHDYFALMIEREHM